jgi:DNA-binding MarR family transcriptional regulator
MRSRSAAQGISVPPYDRAVDEQRDHVATILHAWQAALPGLDVSPIGIFGRITRIDRYQAAALRDVYRRHKLGPGEYDVLAALRRSGPGYRLTPTDLYRTVLVTSATMTERLDRLQSRNLIRRRPVTRDRRSVVAELTPDGRALIDNAITDVLAIESGLLQGLSEQDRAALAELLAKLAAILERSQDGPPA